MSSPRNSPRIFTVETPVYRFLPPGASFLSIGSKKTRIILKIFGKKKEKVHETRVWVDPTFWLFFRVTIVCHQAVKLQLALESYDARSNYPSTSEYKSKCDMRTSDNRIKLEREAPEVFIELTLRFSSQGTPIDSSS